MDEIKTIGIICPVQRRFKELAERQGYYGEALQISRILAERYPYGMEMHAACEVITNLAEELNLPLPAVVR